MVTAARYRQIADDLRRRLADGEFPVGSPLPSISELQRQYEVPGLNTVRQAQAVLQAEGLLAPAQGRGTFVVALPQHANDSEALQRDLDELKEALSKAQSVLSRINGHIRS